MSIVRGPYKERDFTILSNTLLRDERLSYHALGVLTHLLSHEPGWRVSAEELIRKDTRSGGRDAIQKSLRELETLGYAEISKTRDPDTGQWRNNTIIYEEPRNMESPNYPGPENPARVDQALLEVPSKKNHKAKAFRDESSEKPDEQINLNSDTDRIPFSKHSAPPPRQERPPVGFTVDPANRASPKQINMACMLNRQHQLGVPESEIETTTIAQADRFIKDAPTKAQSRVDVARETTNRKASDADLKAETIGAAIHAQALADIAAYKLRTGS